MKYLLYSIVLTIMIISGGNAITSKDNSILPVTNIMAIHHANIQSF